jgi:hypothetical protein
MREIDESSDSLLQGLVCLNLTDVDARMDGELEQGMSINGWTMVFGFTRPVLQAINKRVDDLLLGRRVGVVWRVWRDRNWETMERFVRPVDTSR